MEKFDFSGKRVLVTGGTGFIGGRLVEKLVLECNAKVRVLVRNFASASRIARFPIEMVHGNVTESDDVQAAVDGCDIVFHCAWEVQDSLSMERRVNVEGTRNVLQAALQAGVQRVVHLSTVLVYGAMPDGDFDETTSRNPDNAYAKSNLETEKLAVSYAGNGLAVSVLQPTIVYGPYARAWTVGVLNQLKRGRVILVNGGDGLCNAVYIDDMVSAILLAAVKNEAIGEVFLISGERPVTWKEFYGSYEQILGFSSTVSMTAAKAEAYYTRKFRKGRLFKEAFSIMREEGSVRQRVLETREVNALMKIARQLLPKQIKQTLRSRFSSNGIHQPQGVTGVEKPILPLHPSIIKVNAAKSGACMDKAKRLLGYRPVFDFESGMRLTEQWARWANYLDNKKEIL